MKKLDEIICGKIWTNDEVKRNHKKLCLDYGGRFSGTEEGNKAADFIESKLNEYGLPSVQQDRFKMTQWKRGTARLRMLSPVQRTYPCISLPYAPSCDRKFELVDLGMGHPEDMQGKDIAGKAVLVDDINPSGGPKLHRLQKYVSLYKENTGAFLFVQNEPGMLAPTGSLAFNHNDSEYKAIPSVGLAYEVGREIREWTLQGQVKLEITIENTLSKDEDSNVIGDLFGDSPEEHTIIVCGHYDGHDIAQGAVDNASGTAVIMETARVLSPLRDRLKGKIRFILFGGEEMGLVGSHHYVDQHLDDLSQIRFVFNLDCVGSPVDLVLMLHHASEVKGSLEKMCRDLPSDIHIVDHMVPFSDHFPFFLHGVPAAFCATPGNGRGFGHTIADTFEKVSLETLQRVAAHMARMILRVDQTKKWDGRHRQPEEVKEALKPFLMEELLRHEGHWPFN